MAVEELDKNLIKFYSEARNKEGANYSHSAILSLRNGIERYLDTALHSLGIRFTHDPRFVLSYQMLDAKIKQFKQDGMQNTMHKPAIEKAVIEPRRQEMDEFVCQNQMDLPA